MKLHFLKVTLPLILLLLSACSPSPTPEALPSTSTPEALRPTLTPETLPLTSTPEALRPTSTPEALLPTLPVVESPTEVILQYYPLDTLTGIEELDGVLKAVASGEPEQVRDLFGYTSTTCMTVNALGGPPPCRAGEVEGASVQVLPMLGAEGSFLRRDEAVNFPGLNVIGLYAVYESSESAYSEENYPAGKYGIMLVGAGSEPGFVLQVTDGQIVRIDYIFEISSFGDRLQRDASRFILAPKP